MAIPLHVAEDFDAVQNALRLLCYHAIRDEVTALLSGDEEAAAASHNHAIPRQIANIDHTPSVAVYAQREQVVRTSMRHDRDQLVSWRIDYLLPGTPLDLLPQRYPILRRVWRTIFEAICRGTTPSLMGGADVLEAAGVIEVRPYQAQVLYDVYGERGEEVFPALQATVPILSRPLDATALADFASVLADYDLDTLDDDENPLVQDLITVPST